MTILSEEGRGLCRDIILFICFIHWLFLLECNYTSYCQGPYVVIAKTSKKAELICTYIMNRLMMLVMLFHRDVPSVKVTFIK